MPTTSTPPPTPTARILAPALAVLMLAAAWLPASAQSRHCGTGLWMQRPKEARVAPKLSARSLTSRGAAAAKPVRTLETAHFQIRYVLRGPNRVKHSAEDDAFAVLSDSLYASLSGSLSGDALDSAVFARLDARGAAHPAYIKGMSDLFEGAYRYYVDTLKMRAPDETAERSVYYEARVAKGKYPVDVADIGTADPFFKSQEIYALTYPTGFGGMLMENDFLFNPTELPGGGVRYDSISSRYQGRLIHNYAAEWYLGLKVTCYHELYHSVQFAYTPKENSFHLWYETSATGMEERKAPEVNDYLQYLPAYMDDLGDKGMYGFSEGGLSRYGNGIYHLFLTRDLGEDFDVKLWERLVVNGNDLRLGLDWLYAQYGTTSHEVYARFGAQLAFSGTDAKNPLPAFSSDIPLWPRLPRDTVDLLAQATFASHRKHPPMSIRGLALPGSGSSGKALFHPDTLLRTVVARLRPDSSEIATYRARIVPLDAPGTGGEALAVLVNGSQTLSSGPVEVRLQMSRIDKDVYPYPNPHNRAGGGDLVFSRLERPASVTVYTETGAPLRVMAFAAATGLWSWDLADAKGRKVKSGLYYYRVDDGPLKPFYLR